MTIPNTIGLLSLIILLSLFTSVIDYAVDFKIVADIKARLIDAIVRAFAVSLIFGYLYFSGILQWALDLYSQF